MSTNKFLSLETELTTGYQAPFAGYLRPVTSYLESTGYEQFTGFWGYQISRNDYTEYTGFLKPVTKNMLPDYQRSVTGYLGNEPVTNSITRFYFSIIFIVKCQIWKLVNFGEAMEVLMITRN